MARDLESHSTESEKLAIADLPPVDPARARFPCCLVWTPLPVVAWLVPFVGHLGIGREDGVILDFAGAYFVNVDNFTFGATARYLRLDPGQAQLVKPLADRPNILPLTHFDREMPTSWDDALRITMRQFQHISYNIFTCNCHSFVASCLNTMAYQGRSNWNMVDLVMLIVFKGRWVSITSILQAFAPFLVVAVLGYWVAGVAFLVGLAAFAVLLVGWFLLGTYVLKGVLHP